MKVMFKIYDGSKYTSTETPKFSKKYSQKY